MRIHQASVARLRGLCPYTVIINHEIWGIFSTERAAMEYLNTVYLGMGLRLDSRIVDGTFNEGMEA